MTAYGRRRIPGPIDSAESIAATGGTITTPGDGYRYHSFTADGALTIGAVAGDPLLEMLIVGGGGGGGYSGGGGGGGGQVVVHRIPTPATGDYTVVVGDGGVSANNTDPDRAQGEDSTVTLPDSSVLVGARGGGGGQWSNTYPTPGWNGGGAGGDTEDDTYTVPRTVGGFVGGYSSSDANYGCGGGAGAGEDGANGSGEVGGAGGDGIEVWGTTYGGGGAGTNYGTNASTANAGGAGGGGEGGRSGAMGGTDGTANTGGGGGGSVLFVAGSDGGSGIVKFRYKVGP